MLLCERTPKYPARCTSGIIYVSYRVFCRATYGAVLSCPSPCQLPLRQRASSECSINSCRVPSPQHVPITPRYQGRQHHHHHHHPKHSKPAAKSAAKPSTSATQQAITSMAWFSHSIMAVAKSWCRLESVGKPFLLVRNTFVDTMTAFTGSPTHRSRMLCAGKSAVISSTTDKLTNQNDRHSVSACVLCYKLRNKKRHHSTSIYACVLRQDHQFGVPARTAKSNNDHRKIFGCRGLLFVNVVANTVVEHGLRTPVISTTVPRAQRKHVHQTFETVFRVNTLSPLDRPEPTDNKRLSLRPTRAYVRLATNSQARQTPVLKPRPKNNNKKK